MKKKHPANMQHRYWAGIVQIELFEKVVCQENVTFEQVVEALKKNRGELEALLDYFDSDGDDWRNGEDTYGYESKQDIIEQLQYISDRFLCQFRLRWMLGILDENVLRSL